MICESCPTVVICTATWCGHCRYAAPEFERLSNMSGLHVINLKDGENDKMIDWFKIDGFPSIFVHKNSTWSKFLGERTSDAIFQYIKSEGQSNVVNINTYFPRYECSKVEEMENIDNICPNCPTVFLYIPDSLCDYCQFAKKDFDELQTKDGLHVYSIRTYNKNLGDNCPTIYVYYPTNQEWYVYTSLDRSTKKIWESVIKMDETCMYQIDLKWVNIRFKTNSSQDLVVCKDCPTYVVVSKEYKSNTAEAEGRRHVIYLNVDNDSHLVRSFNCDQFPSTFKYEPSLKTWSRIVDSIETPWNFSPNVKN